MYQPAPASNWLHADAPVARHAISDDFSGLLDSELLNPTELLLLKPTDDVDDDERTDECELVDVLDVLELLNDTDTELVETELLILDGDVLLDDDDFSGELLLLEIELELADELLEDDFSGLDVLELTELVDRELRDVLDDDVIDPELGDDSDDSPSTYR